MYIFQNNLFYRINTLLCANFLHIRNYVHKKLSLICQKEDNTVGVAQTLDTCLASARLWVQTLVPLKKKENKCWWGYKKRLKHCKLFRGM
jgi:hypothetical protein